MPAILTVAALAVMALAAAAALGYLAIFRRPLPRTYGRLAVDGLVAPLEIVRDEASVPHVSAASERDAAFAVGFLHGQERLWYIELLRRIAAGRVSEMIGERGLPVDRLMRRLGLRRVSEAEWHVTHATGELRRLLKAYAAGVNAAMADRPLPAELTILRHRPQPWEPEDTLAIGRLLGLSQARSWEAALVRARLLKAAGPRVAVEVDPTLRAAAGAASPAGIESALAGIVADLAAADAILPLSSWTAASNAWAVSGRRTDSGSPLLAGDPHSALTIPSLWYQVHLSHPGSELSGLTACGLPFVLLGHNRDVAWSLSNAGISLQDLYVERFNPNNPLQFEDGGGWQDAVRFRETIRVRGGEPVTEDVLVTRRGPVISPALGGQQPPLSLRWVSLDSEIDSLGWLMRLNRATGWPSFRAAIASCPSPALAVTFADVAGSIGWRVSGFIPRRPPGAGWLPLPGWDGSGEWEGFLGMDEVPEAFNPPEGVVICANQRLPGAERLPGEPLPPFRAARIAELLGDRIGLTVDDMVTIQADTLSTPARRLRALLLSHLGPGTAWASLAGDAAGTLRLIHGWDCRTGAESPAALACERLLGWLRRRVLVQTLGEPLAAQVSGGEVHPVLPGGPYLAHADAAVLDLLESGRPEPGAEPDLARVARLLAVGLQAVTAEIVDRYGEDPRGWRWGDDHQLAFVHPLARAFPALAPLLSRGPLRASGDLHTVNLSSRGPDAGLLPGYFGPVFRAVYDLSDWGASRGGLVPGQSGHPGSPAYADLIEDWLAVRLRPLPWGDAPDPGDRLRLSPRAGGAVEEEDS